ncbi:MAG: pantetheine-phosphate adenylyltransferase [bacterium]|nr:pantetheine-phosphate adenylyltransferase [bacterium]MCY3925295.1 pantetheine-phosphate adenylyltransferase [bacterium]
MVRVLYPGSFDPVHNGHVELVEMAADLFDEVVVAAMRNPQKGETLFGMDEREAMLKESFAHLSNVQTTMFGELVVTLARREMADFIVKGLRAVSDFENELQMAQTNREVAGVPTVFLPSTSASSFIASKYIREIARFGGDVTSMVPPAVAQRLRDRWPAP